MNYTYIIGTGYLSKNLNKKIVRSKIYSAENFIKKISSLNSKKKKLI